MANQWPASQNWPYKKDGYASLKKTLQNLEASVYIDPNATNDPKSLSSYSFTSDTMERMSYPEFLQEMSKHETGMTARSKSHKVTKSMEKDIIFPEFYHEFAEFEDIQLTQA